MKSLVKNGIILSFVFFISCGEKENRNQENNEEVSNKETKVEVGVDDNLQNEADFLIMSHMNSQLQIALGEVADRNALSPEVKQFSTTIIAGNSLIQNNLQELASAAEIDLNPALTPDYIAMIDTIQSYQGAKFDSAFLSIVIEEHEEDIDRLLEFAGKTDNAIVRREVTENVEILQEQVTQAEKIKDSLN